MAEEPLAGGITNAGRVARDGQHLLRPSSPYTGSVHRFLRSLADAGFDGAPKPVGVDDDGRERLQFIDGEVPTSPYPLWSQSDTTLASIAELVRRYHRAAAAFDPRALPWSGDLADPAGGPILCHNDLELSNIVFRDGIAVAFIDFEFAAPGRPIYDLGQMARLCVPIEHELDRDRMGWRPSDGPARLRLIADAYGLDATSRRELPAALDDAIDRIEIMARRSAAEGAGTAAAMAATGGIEKYDRRRRWWQRNRASFVAALR